MTKRLLSLMLALMMVLSMLPVVGVSAEGTEHVHCLCGEETTKGNTCEECKTEAVVWEATDSLPTADGNYYLTGDVSAAAQFLNNNEKISLCLHGHKVTSAAGKKFLYLNKNVIYNISLVNFTLLHVFV